MVQTCHAAGVKIYVDAVVNHMAGGASTGTGSGGSTYCHYAYPAVPYGTDDFHHCGRNGNDDIVNYGDRWEVQNCELVDLSDLKTESSYVRGKLTAYLNDLVSLGVDGFRVDAAKHMPAADLAAILAPVTGDPYVFSEVIEGGSRRADPGGVRRHRRRHRVPLRRRGRRRLPRRQPGQPEQPGRPDAARLRRRGGLRRQPRHPAQRPGHADLQERHAVRARRGVHDRLPVRRPAGDVELHLQQRRRRARPPPATAPPTR